MNQSSSSTTCTVKERGRPIAKFNNTKKQRRTSPPPVANKKCRTQGAGGTSKFTVRKRARDLKLVWMSFQQQQKSRFHFTATPGININPSDPKNFLSVLKTFIFDDMIDNFVQYTNDYADVIINTPEIKARKNKFKKSMFSKWTPTNRDKMGYSIFYPYRCMDDQIFKNQYALERMIV